MMTNQRLFLLLIGCALLFQSCKTATVISLEREFLQIDELNKLDKKDKYIKVHLKNGEIYVLKKWDTNAQKDFLTGLGIHYDASRDVISKRLTKTRAPQSQYKIDVTQIDFIERNSYTNQQDGDRKFAVLAGLTAVVGVIFWSIVASGF